METIKERKNKAVEANYELEPEFPKEIFIDFTSFCNHACIFCANKKLKNKREMDYDMAMRVLHEAYDNGTREIGIYATGESFLVKNLKDYVAEAKKIGYTYQFITTNGALATPDRVKPVLDAGLNSIKFSISAGKPETYKIIQGRDDFTKVISNLKWIHEYRNKAKLDFRIYVTMVYTDATKDEVNLLKEIVIPYIDEWDPHLLTNQCGNMFENNKIGNIEEKNIRGRVKAEICFQPFKGFTVTPEGYISACVLDYQKNLIVGDLNKQSMKEIWNSDIYRNLRKKHIEKNLKGLCCYNCVNNTNEIVTPTMPEFTSHFKEN
ncbi:MAG: radical SAM protein [Pseudomonadota bacterium]